MHCALLADIGVPMIFVQWPLMICALLPVIVIEALVVRKRLALSYRRAFAGAAQANVVSTLAGVPLAWGLMFFSKLHAQRLAYDSPPQFAGRGDHAGSLRVRGRGGSAPAISKCSSAAGGSIPRGGPVRASVARSGDSHGEAASPSERKALPRIQSARQGRH